MHEQENEKEESLNEPSSDASTSKLSDRIQQIRKQRKIMIQQLTISERIENIRNQMRIIYSTPSK